MDNLYFSSTSEWHKSLQSRTSYSENITHRFMFLSGPSCPPVPDTFDGKGRAGGRSGGRFSDNFDSSQVEGLNRKYLRVQCTKNQGRQSRLWNVTVIRSSGKLILQWTQYSHYDLGTLKAARLTLMPSRLYCPPVMKWFSSTLLPLHWELHHTYTDDDDLSFGHKSIHHHS